MSSEIVSLVKAASVKHLDETGFRIGGKTNWLHVVSTETETWYGVIGKRKDIEILADIKGVVAHDQCYNSKMLITLCVMPIIFENSKLYKK